MQLGGGGGSGPTITIPTALPSAVTFVSIAAPEFGSDIPVFPDLDDTLTPRTGTAIVLDAVARRFVTARGVLWAHPDYGRDLRQYLNAPMTSSTLARIKADVEDQAKQDERVDSAKASVSYDAPSQRVRIRLALGLDSGPFALTLVVSQLTVELLTGA
jgi:hypothetical protein